MSYKNPSVIRRNIIVISFIFAGFVLSSCISLPKYTTIRSEQPPNYYLGESPNIQVVDAEGATRRMQDIAIQELRNQSRSGGHFTVENAISEGIRFDTRQGRVVMTGKDVPANANDVFIKFNVIASMKQDGRTTVTRSAGILGTQEETVPVMMTVMPVAFTVTRGDEVLLNERQYNGKAVWALNERGGGYPTDYRQRLEAAIGQAVKEFLVDITPKTVSRDVQLDYSDEKQKPILDAARDGQVKEAATQLADYVQDNPNSSSAVYNLAVLTDALGQYERALTYYDKALSLGGKDYYTEAKSSCMKRINEQREMKSAEPTAPSDQPSPTTRQTDSSQSGEQKSQQRPGNGGEDTQWVQSTLNNLGYKCGTADGVMGANTRSCIRSFQKTNNLRVTGSINEATYSLMLKKIE